MKYFEWSSFRNLVMNKLYEIVNKCHEQVVKKSWTNQKQVVKKMWKVVNKLWTSCYQIMNKFWTNCEQIVIKAWTSHERVAKSCKKVAWTNGEKSWTSHVVVMYKSKLFLAIKVIYYLDLQTTILGGGWWFHSVMRLRLSQPPSMPGSVLKV